MSAGFAPGVRVVCLDDPWRDLAPRLGVDAPRRSSVYTIRCVKASRALKGGFGLRFAELRNGPVPGLGPDEPRFAVAYFRPLDERRIDQFRAHLAARERETA